MIEALDPTAGLSCSDELRHVYLAAFGAPGYDEDATAAERFAAEQLPTHAGRAGFRLVVARDPDGELTGFAYGYTGERGQWWSDRLVETAPEIADEWVGGHFEFVELAVVPAAQGQGLGAALHDALMADLPHAKALLSTYADDRPAPRLYRRKGWQLLLPDLTPTSALYGKKLR
ncbi:GNAT family N-acetyltransferase [Kribbella sp. CA-253562]|uniref:GNAT family N-acetyltransferase n=1 Tax=Kribbella sp. CA-253562 TaxID=3239942 RepID=UPI003D8FF02B